MILAGIEADNSLIVVGIDIQPSTRIANRLFKSVTNDVFVAKRRIPRDEKQKK